MADITLKGNPIQTVGNLPAVGSPAPDFSLTNTDLADISLKDYAGKNVILNIFPSLDTPVCASSIRRFNEEASKVDNTIVVCASLDLPFAHKRFCAAEGIENVVSASEMHTRTFGEDYGVRIANGPLAGIFSRAIVVIGSDGNVKYTEQVPEITEEPNYDAALASLS